MAKALKTAALTIRFSEEEVDAMRTLAEAEDLSAAAIVRRALREYIERNAKKPKKGR